MPTISVRQYDYETLKMKLRHTDRIVILSCDGCARQSADLGGRKGLDSLADKLVADGFKVVHRALLPVACSPDHWQKHLSNETARKLIEEADVMIPLSCEAGEKRAREAMPGVTLFRVTKTLGKGTFSPESGAFLTRPSGNIKIDINESEGLPIGEAAKRLALYLGNF